MIMDTFTHGLFPFLFGKAGKKGKEACTALLVGGLAPDFDILFLFARFFLGFFSISVPSSLLLTHRGITHSIIFGIIFSWLALYVASRKPVLAAFNYIFKSDISILITPKVLLFAGLGALSHMFLDFTTTYGVPLLYPFTTERYSLELFFYVDPYLIAAGAGMTAFAFYKRNWFKTPFGSASNIGIESTYKKLFYVMIAALLLFGGLRFYEKNISAEYFSTGIDAVYPSFSPFVWYVEKQDSDNKTITVYEFNAPKRAVLSQYSMDKTAFANAFPRHSRLVGQGI